MSTIDKNTLISSISPPLDSVLSEQMLDEFISLDKRYRLKDWEPATLDGGQFCEAVSRLLYHQDSGILNRRKGVNTCLSYIEDVNSTNVHNYAPRKPFLHLCKVLRAIYKFRSDRGAVHIDPDYTANHIDARLVMENTHWVFSEILRLFWNSDIALVSRAIREIADFNVPVIAKYEDKFQIQRTDCTTEEEILILLYHAGENGFERKTINSSVMKSSSSISTSIKNLSSASKREIIKLNNNYYRLTDLGIKRVMESLADKF